MLSNKFTFLELLDLALRVPEVGAVNFNILHTVLTQLVIQVGLDSIKLLCNIENEVAAQAAITKGRMEDPNIRVRRKGPARSVTELKNMIDAAHLKGKEEQIPIPEEEKKDAEKDSTKDSEDIHLDLTESKDETIKEDDQVSVDPENVQETQLQTTPSKAHKPDSKLQITLPETKESGKLDEVSDREKADDVREVAKEILQKTTDAPAAAKDILKGAPEEETAAVATQALKVLAEEEIFDTDPSKVVQEMWRAININRRMDGAEEGLRELSNIVDMMLDKVQTMEEETQDALSKMKLVDSLLNRMMQCEKACDSMSKLLDETIENSKEDATRLDELINGLAQKQEDIETAMQNLSKKYEELAGLVAYKKDLVELHEQMSETLSEREREIRMRIQEVEDMITPKDVFAELVSRLDKMNDDKVNREDLGQLAEPGFIEKFINEQLNLLKDVEELKVKESSLEENFDGLIKRIDEEILKSIEESFAEVNGTIVTMRAKLDTLDADDINDSFARLEEQADMVLKELEELKTKTDHFEKEARGNFQKISDITMLLEKLENTKVDKSKMYELLETKADVEMVSSKLDRNEFVAVVREVKGDLERLTIVVKIQEEEMSDGFRKIRHELSLKMYTEDFISATEPIRHRIKAMMYEQKRIKEIALSQLLPDAPGVVKCFSCNREASLKSRAKERILTPVKLDVTPSDEKSVKFPPIDIDFVPLPPPDKQRIQDAALLPVLFATARPQVGLAHERRRTDIDKELEDFFSSENHRVIGGKHTKTKPQQKGLSFTTMKVPYGKKTDVLLQGFDKRFYKGTIVKNKGPDIRSRKK